VAELGVIIENEALQAALLAQCLQVGITLLQDRVRSLVVGTDGARLQLEQGALHAQLVVGADGAASAVREMAGLPAGTREYGQRAIVAVVRTTRPHRGTAYQRFLGTGPLALLPLPGETCSIVWSATDERAAALLAMPVPEFEAALTVASAGVLGNLSLAGERAAFPLRRLSVQRYVAPRIALVGDAAHVIHPLAGQGVNQGFEDAAALARLIGQRPVRESAGAVAALRRYERERRAGNALVGAVVDGLDRLFTGSGPLTSWAARSGMALVARAAPVRRFLISQAGVGAHGRRS
jgi:2-octaprenylphenol hydroxylase